MNDFITYLDQLNEITPDTPPLDVEQLIYLLESTLESIDKKQIRSTFSPEAFLHKMSLYYVSRYKYHYYERQAEFCAEHDNIIYELARFFITAVHLKLISFELTAPFHALLSLPPLPETIPILHFSHNLLLRLLADEEMVASFGTQLSIFLEKVATSLIEMVGLGVSFGLTANANLLSMMLLKLIENDNLNPLDSEIEDESILAKLPQVEKSDIQVKQVKFSQSAPDNAEVAISNSWDHFRVGLVTLQEVLLITYSACLHLLKENGEIAVDLLFTIFKCASYYQIKLLRFCISPIGMRYFILKWKAADMEMQTYIEDVLEKQQELNKRDEEYKKLDKALQLAVQKLPSEKYLLKFREECVEMAQRFIELQIRCLSLVNKKEPEIFGKLLSEFMIEINESLYVSELAIDLSNNEEFADYMARFLMPRTLLVDAYVESESDKELGKQEILCIKEFSMEFAIPYYNFEGMPMTKVYEEPIVSSEDNNSVKIGDLLQQIDIKNCEKVMVTIEVLSNLYYEYLSTSLHENTNQFLNQNITNCEAQGFIEIFVKNTNETFAFIRKCYMSSALRGYCVIENFDNFEVFASLISLFQLETNEDKPFEIISILISSMISEFDNYNITLAIQLFIGNIISRQLNTNDNNIRDQLYSSCKQLLRPGLSGFKYNYSNLIIKYHDFSDIDVNIIKNSNYEGLSFEFEYLSNYLQSAELIEEGNVILTKDILENNEQDIILYEQEYTLSGIIETISLLSQMLDDMYEKFPEQLCGGFYKLKSTADYNQILENVIISIVQTLMPYLQNIDVSIIENMNYLLLELFEKLAIKAPISSCALIVGLKHESSLLLKVQEVLLGWTIQMIAQQRDNTEYLAAFLFSCLLSDHKEKVYIELLNNKVLYSSNKMFPFRILSRSLLGNNEIDKSIADQMRNYYSKNTEYFFAEKFLKSLDEFEKDDKLYYLIGKLIELLFESSATTRTQLNNLYEVMIVLIFDIERGLLSYISGKQECQNSANNDASQDSIMLLFMNLSQICTNPDDNNNIIEFVNYYLICYAKRYKIESSFAISKFLDNTLISEADIAKDLFQRLLAFSSIDFSNVYTFSYCFTQICHDMSCTADATIIDQKKEVLLFLCKNITKFENQLDCNILIQAISVDSYEIEIHICRYLKSQCYYLDKILLNSIVQLNTDSYFDAFIRKNQLLREIYDIEFITYEGILPLLLEKIKARAISPAQYLNYIFDQKTVIEQCPYSNIISSELQQLQLHSESLEFNNESIEFGVFQGDKNSLWLKELPKKYFKDVRDIYSQSTILALMYERTITYPEFRLLLSEMAGLEILFGKKLQYNEVTLEEALHYISCTFKDVNTRSLRYASIPLRNHLSKILEGKIFRNYEPITDFIPDIYAYEYIRLTSGYEFCNKFDTNELAAVDFTKNQTSNAYQPNYQWIEQEVYYSTNTINIALQVICEQCTKNNVNECIAALLNVLSNQLLDDMLEERGDTFKFFKFIPFTSQNVQKQVLLVIRELTRRFSFEKGESGEFCILDDSFSILSQAMINEIVKEELTMELLNYNKTIVQFYYNKELRRPKLNEELEIHYLTCYLASEIAGNMGELGYCSNIERIVQKHVELLCEYNFAQIAAFLLFALQKENGYILQYITKSNKLNSLLYILQRELKFDSFTANIYNSLIASGHYAANYETLLKQLVDNCVNSALFKTILSKLEGSEENIRLLEGLKQKTLNDDYIEQISEFTILNSGDLTELSLDSFIKKVSKFGEKEIDYLFTAIVDTNMSIFEFSQRQFELDDSIIKYITDKFSEFGEREVKILSYLSACFGAENFESLFCQIPYFTQESGADEEQLNDEDDEIEASSPEQGDSTAGEEVDDGFNFDDFKDAEEEKLVFDTQLFEQTIGYFSPLLAGLPNFTTETLANLLVVIPTLEDNRFSAIAVFLLSAMSCFDFSEWYGQICQTLLLLLENIDQDYEKIAQVIQYIQESDETERELFKDNKLFVRIESGMLEKPKEDEINLKFGFI